MFTMPSNTFTTTRRMTIAAAVSVLMATVLGACSGVPVTSIPRLLRLNGQLLDAKPAEFMVAIQLDTRMTPPPGGVPVLEVTVEPREPGAFASISKKVPMRLVDAIAGANEAVQLRAFGLDDAPKGRRWLVYHFGPESQAELVRIQTAIKQLLKDKQTGSGPGKGGGTSSVGIDQGGIPIRDPAYANTRWESWLQTRQSEGFYELYSSTVGALLKQAGGR